MGIQYLIYVLCLIALMTNALWVEIEHHSSRVLQTCYWSNLYVFIAIVVTSSVLDKVLTMKMWQYFTRVRIRQICLGTKIKGKPSELRYSLLSL